MKQQGFTSLYNSDLRNNKISTTTRCLLGIITSYCYDKDYCFPSLGTLATDLGKSVRTVQRCLNVLKSMGYVTIKNRGHKSNLYTLIRRVVLVNQEKSTRVAKAIERKARGYKRGIQPTRNFTEREMDYEELERQLTAHQRE